MSWLWPDEPPDEPLPYYAVGVCDECLRPAEELVEGLGECCRCHSCGEPTAPVELDERRLCMACATDLGRSPTPSERTWLARIVAPDHVSAPSDAIAALGPALGERP